MTIENLDGQVLRTWLNPSLEFLDHTDDPLADDLHLVFFCGFSIWNYLTTPFLLARPDVDSGRTVRHGQENDQTWRRLRACFHRISSLLSGTDLLFRRELPAKAG